MASILCRLNPPGWGRGIWNLRTNTGEKQGEWGRDVSAAPWLDKGHCEIREVALSKTDKGPTMTSSKLLGNSVRLRKAEGDH